MSEPITQELRKAMIKYGWCDGDNIVFSNYPPNIDEEQALLIRSSRFDNLCDAIDAVHANLERENESLRRELDRVTGEMEEHHAWAPESHYVMLPKDADGEPIHIGDVMDSKVDYLFDGKPFTVRGLVLCEDGWEVTDGRFGNRYKPDSLHHHREPTVEDVLREFVDALDIDRCEDFNATIAEYAAKLQLRGDAE